MTKSKIVELKAVLRQEIGKAADHLRQENKIPAVFYGHETENQNLAVGYADFERVYQEAGESSLVNLKIGESEPVKILIHEVQSDPITGRPIHVDFYKVNMKEKIKAEVEIEFTGEAPAVKEAGAVLVKTLNKFHIECLPTDLVHKIEVDLSVLKQIGDTIRVADVKIPEGITVLNSPETMVALTEELKQEIFKEEAVPAAATEGELPPTEAELKAAEEAKAEGEEEKK